VLGAKRFSGRMRIIKTAGDRKRIIEGIEKECRYIFTNFSGK
jgi:hypothetical protein